MPCDKPEGMHCCLQVKEVPDRPEAADEAIKADVRALLRHIKTEAEQADQCPTDGDQSDLHQRANMTGGAESSSQEDKWPLEHFLDEDRRLDASSPSTVISGTEKADGPSAPATNVVCIISNDLGFDKLLWACKNAGCQTVAMCDLTHSTYKHADVLLSWEMAESGLY